jgi:hypothetical protein
VTERCDAWHQSRGPFLPLGRRATSIGFCRDTIRAPRPRCVASSETGSVRSGAVRPASAPSIGKGRAHDIVPRWTCQLVSGRYSSSCRVDLQLGGCTAAGCRLHRRGLGALVQVNWKTVILTLYGRAMLGEGGARW